MLKHATIKLLFKYLILVSCALLVSCSPNHRVIAKKNNFGKKLFFTKNFVITTYIRSTPKLAANAPLFVYLEGDGRAWITKYRLSDNPTPIDPLMLKLAALDPHANVIYIARPCQYTPLELDPNCCNKYWSTFRYSKEVVDSMNQVIDDFIKIVNQFQDPILNINSKRKHNQIHLIGYSGGATIASLIAAQRNEILSIRTIAGNLDHDAVSEFHQTTKLSGSLNPVNFIDRIKHIPQIHYIGENDQIVPIEVITNFTEMVNQHGKQLGSICGSYQIIKDLDHYHGWEKFWKQQLDYLPTCYKADP